MKALAPAPRLLAASCMLALALPLAAQQPQPPACATPEYRQFDFWIGTCEVFAPNGQRAGTNTIDSVLGGCALHEQWTSAGGGHGFSYNIYDFTRQVWHQTWVDASGTLLQIEGGLVNGAMVLEGRTVGRNGPVLNRITWTPLARDSVRQRWEVRGDTATAWTTVFNGLYVRRN